MRHHGALEWWRAPGFTAEVRGMAWNGVDPGAPVFPSPAKAGTPLSDMTLAAALKRMGRGDLTVHGFRSTFRDWAGEATAHPREVIEAALAHRLQDKAEAAYARGDLFAKRRKLMEDWAAYLAQAGDVPAPERALFDPSAPAAPTGATRRAQEVVHSRSSVT